MKPWQRAMLRRYQRVGKGLGPIVVIASVTFMLAVTDNPVSRALRGLDDPRLAYSLVFIAALVPLVGLKLWRERG